MQVNTGENHTTGGSSTFFMPFQNSLPQLQQQQQVFAGQIPRCSGSTNFMPEQQQQQNKQVQVPVIAEVKNNNVSNVQGTSNTSGEHNYVANNMFSGLGNNVDTGPNPVESINSLLGVNLITIHNHENCQFTVCRIWQPVG